MRMLKNSVKLMNLILSLNSDVGSSDDHRRSDDAFHLFEQRSASNSLMALM